MNWVFGFGNDCVDDGGSVVICTILDLGAKSNHDFANSIQTSCSSPWEE